MSQKLSRQPVVSNQVMGMLIFVFTEIMIFASFISSFNIVRSSFSVWPPLGQPRLPVAFTALNSIFLLASAFALHFAYKRFQAHRSIKDIKGFYLASLILGLIFVVFQGREWVNLIRFGLTMTSSLYGSFFYLIIGGHALHVLLAVAALIFMYRRLINNQLALASFSAVRVFWFFVVGLWPILYGLVYL